MNHVKLIVLAGEPATGKTTVFQKLRARIRFTKKFKYNLVRGRMNAAGTVLMLGVFDGSTHEGTDKLSMAVQPDLLKFLALLEKKGKKVAVIFEGDRLSNASLLEALPKESYALHILTSNRQAENIAKRGTEQSEKFLGAKRTKIANLMKKFPHNVLENNNPDDPDAIAEALLVEVEDWV